jgi:hypothetical protein
VEGDALGEELHVVEQGLHQRLLELGRLLLTEVILRHDERDVGETHTQGGATRRRQGMRQRAYISIFGAIPIERAYYWDKENGGYSPLDAALNLPERSISYLLQKWIQKRVTKEAYTEAIADIEEVLGLQLPKRTQEQITEEAASEAGPFYEERPAPSVETEGCVIGVQADGKGVRMVGAERPAPPAEQAGPRRKKGEKPGLRRMAVATADYSFDPQPRTPEEMVAILMKEQSPQERAQEREARRERRSWGEEDPRRPRNAHIEATLAGKEAAFTQLAQRVRERDPTGLKPVVLLADGEKALENQLRAAFRKAGLWSRVDALILDIMHAMEYLWEAGTALHGEQGNQRTSWVRQQALAILQGRVGYVIGGLRRTNTRRAGQLSAAQRKTLEKVSTYFDNHKHMMQYDVYLAKGYPIGTGLIEGTCRSLVKDRMDISGAKWTRSGAEAVLTLRAVNKNGDWDAYWEYYTAKNKARLYQTGLN